MANSPVPFDPFTEINNTENTFVIGLLLELPDETVSEYTDYNNLIQPVDPSYTPQKTIVEIKEQQTNFTSFETGAEAFGDSDWLGDEQVLGAFLAVAYDDGHQ